MGHFQKDCKATLNSQDDDRDDAALSDTNPNIGRMSHTLTTSRLITDLTFKAILKTLLSLVIGNRKALCPKPQSTQKNISQPSMNGANPTVMSAITAVNSTSFPQTTSQPTLSTISSGSISLPGNPGRGPLQTRCQAAVS